MKLRMKTNINASPDRIRVFFYEQGKVYSRESDPRLDAMLEEVFLAEGWAEEVKEDVPAPSAEPFPAPTPPQVVAPPAASPDPAPASAAGTVKPKQPDAAPPADAAKPA